jgi:flavodoxin
MKTLVTYMTVSGQTKKVADAIFEVVEEQKEIQPISEVKGLEGVDLAFVGSPMHRFGLHEKVREFIENNGRGKNIALFVTHSMPEGGEPLQEWLDNCRNAAAGTNLVGFFNCQGEMSKELADLMVNSGDPQAAAWGEAREKTLGQPDATRLERARAFAREVLSKVS